jgi:hypothetical protein
VEVLQPDLSLIPIVWTTALPEQDILDFRAKKHQDKFLHSLWQLRGIWIWDAFFFLFTGALFVA